MLGEFNAGVGSLCLEEVKAMFQAVSQQKLIISPCIDDPTPNTMWDNLKSGKQKTSADVLEGT